MPIVLMDDRCDNPAASVAFVANLMDKNSGVGVSTMRPVEDAAAEKMVVQKGHKVLRTGAGWVGRQSDADQFVGR